MVVCSDPKLRIVSFTWSSPTRLMTMFVALLSEMMIMSTAASRTVISTPSVIRLRTPEPRQRCSSPYRMRSVRLMRPSWTAQYRATRTGTLIRDAVAMTSSSWRPILSSELKSVSAYVHFPL